MSGWARLVFAGAVAGSAVAGSAEPPKFWSFVPPMTPVVPAVADGSWPRNAIDRFVMARLAAAGLDPAEPAEPTAWLRRGGGAL